MEGVGGRRAEMFIFALDHITNEQIHRDIPAEKKKRQLHVLSGANVSSDTFYCVVLVVFSV